MVMAYKDDKDDLRYVILSALNGGQNTACRDVFTDYFLRHFYSRGKVTSFRNISIICYNIIT